MNAVRNGIFVIAMLIVTTMGCAGVTTGNPRKGTSLEALMNQNFNLKSPAYKSWPASGRQIRILWRPSWDPESCVTIHWSTEGPLKIVYQSAMDSIRVKSGVDGTGEYAPVSVKVETLSMSTNQPAPIQLADFLWGELSEVTFYEGEGIYLDASHVDLEAYSAQGAMRQFSIYGPLEPYEASYICRAMSWYKTFILAANPDIRLAWINRNRDNFKTEEDKNWLDDYIANLPSTEKLLADFPAFFEELKKESAVARSHVPDKTYDITVHKPSEHSVSSGYPDPYKLVQ